ncbi:MAG: SIR2 family NAD-dependent protein deacylase [Anaerovoracaceae bacterium]|jgi:NAD-dependent SIR2 family protein deacetylase
MSFYEELVTEAQMNYSRYYSIYMRGGTAIELSKKEPLPYEQQIKKFAEMVSDAECIVVGGASGLSAAGGGNFYYEDNAAYRKYFGKFAEKYGFQGAFAGTFAHWDSREEFWGYMATFLNTTQNAPAREPYLDLDSIIDGKDFFVLTTNQDTQFLRLYPERKVAEVQGDHRFFQCSRCCTDKVYDAVEPVKKMVKAMGEGTSVPQELIPRCPNCGAEMFPWVRGYGNFLTGTKYGEEYQKISDYILAHKDKKILFLELGVGRMTPMFIQEPFWMLTKILPRARYINVNAEFAFTPREIENQGIAIKGDIAKILKDVCKEMK